MNTLCSRDAYKLWAPSYTAETPISFLDDELCRVMCPPSNGLRLLDAGCGVARRLDGQEVALAVGVDLSCEMLAVSDRSNVAAADIRGLPFKGNEFDIIWCRLVLGHLVNPSSAYCELARVCRSGGYLFVTDFHPHAVAAGHRRGFRSPDGALHEVKHYVHDVHAHIAMAQDSGLILMSQRDGLIGPTVQEFYRRASRMEIYERDKGLAVVSAFLFRRAD